MAQPRRGGAAMTRRLLALTLALFALAACHRGRAARAHYPNAPVIIISIDTLRADHLPMFGYKAVETPSLDALRRDSILFTNAFSSVPLTLPSHVSMLTGLLPPDNRVRNNIGYQLDASVPTIPRLLKARGYDTGGAVSAYVLRGSTGIAPSFDFYDDGVVTKPGAPVGTLQRAGGDTEAIAARWIAEHQQKPFFFFLHLFEPHSPYEPPEPFKSRYASAPYDGEIATADKIVGDFLQTLKSSGVYDKAIIVLLSDHGEGLNQHGESEHGIFLYREDIHVPLLLKLPDGARSGETDANPVGLIDILPTIAELTEAPAPAKLDGKSLLHHQSADAARRIYSETLYPRIHLGWSELRSLEDARFHFIQAPKPELYDMSADPGETKNVLTEERRVYASMRDALGSLGAQIELPTHIDPEEAKKLAALGYLSSSSPQASGPLPDPKDRIGEIAEMVAASRLMAAGKNDEAIAAFRKITEENPRLADAWDQLGDLLDKTGRYEEAAAVFRKAIQTTPELSAEFGLRLAAILLKLEQFDDAAKHARLGEKTNYGSAHVLLSRIALAKKDYATAEAEARLAAKDELARVPATVLLAQIESTRNHPQQALELIDQAEKEAEQRHLGNIETLQFVRGDALARMQRYDAAIPAFQREIADFPHDKQAYASLFLVYLLTNRQAEATQTIEQMVAANPNRRGYLFAAHTLDAVNDKRGAEALRKRAQDFR
jgi:arylsulfatase A-like enzyme/predicted Zn-dependent protease